MRGRTGVRCGMSDGRSFDDLAGDLADMAPELLEPETVQDTLDVIVARAVALVDGCEVAGILAVRRHEVETLVASRERLLSSQIDLVWVVGLVLAGPGSDLSEAPV